MPAITDEKTLALLSRLLGGLNPLLHPVEARGDFPEKITSIDLPAAPGAEYFFKVWFYEGGERQISAQLIQHRSDKTYFWYRALELAEFRGSEGDLVNEFCEELEALLTHETRIVQRKGWIFWHFCCEYRDGEKWKNVCGHSAFRGGGFKPPQIKGRKRVYYAAPVAGGH